MRNNSARHNADVVCDVIILTMDQEDVLRPCIDSIIRSTTIPLRVIIINNGGVNIRPYLDSLVSTELITFLIVHNEKNVGYIKGNNQALALSHAPYICLLNNDTIVTSGWIEEMIRLCREKQNIGLVNPRSNQFGAFPKEGQSLDELAGTMKADPWEYTPVGICIGFCLVFRRELMEKVGIFDEHIGEMLFEDADLALRVKRAGYVCVVARRAYVYHLEHKGMQTRSKKEIEEIFQKSRRYFESKWGKSLRVAFVCDEHAQVSLSTPSLSEMVAQLIDEDNAVTAFLKTYSIGSREDLEQVWGRSLTPLRMGCVCRRKAFFRIIVWWALMRKIKKGYDVVLVSDYWSAVMACLFCVLCKKKLVYLSLNGMIPRFLGMNGVAANVFIYDETRQYSGKNRITRNEIGELRTFFKMKNA